MNHVEKKDAGGCWEWTGSMQNSGYGYVIAKYEIDKEMRRVGIGAHRRSYELFVGDLIDGMVIAHTCDNKKCVNPIHLFQCTQKENLNDMFNKGRASINEKHYKCKLSNEEIQEIKLSDLKVCKIARKYNISHSYVSQIRSGKRRKHAS